MSWKPVTDFRVDPKRLPPTANPSSKARLTFPREESYAQLSSRDIKKSERSPYDLHDSTVLRQKVSALKFVPKKLPPVPPSQSKPSKTRKPLQDPIQHPFMGITQQLRTQSQQVQRLEEKVDMLVDRTASGIRAILKEVGAARADGFAGRKEVLESVRVAFDSIKGSLNALEGSRGLRNAAAGQQMLGDQNAGFTIGAMDWLAIQEKPNANVVATGTGGLSTPSNLSALTNDSWYTAPGAVQPLADFSMMDFGTAPVQPDADLLHSLGLNPNSRPDFNTLTAFTQGPLNTPNLYQPLDLNFPQAADLPEDVLRSLQEVVETASALSSGIEPLPSDCSSESATIVPFNPDLTDYTDYTGPIRNNSRNRALRERVKTVDYVSHPMDHNMGNSEKVSDAASSSDRRDIRGRSALPPLELTLSASDGKKTEARWPPLGANTIKGRLQEVSCDECKARVHWACAGFSDHHLATNEPWSCPACILAHEKAEGEMEPIITMSQTERCARPDCVLNLRKPVERKTGDNDQFHFERIVGRLSLGGSSKKVFEYLVKWVGWEMFDCTWEPASHIGDFSYWRDHFHQAARAAGIESIWKVTLLPECERYWDDKGDLKIDVLEDEGVELKEWMIDSRRQR